MILLSRSSRRRMKNNDAQTFPACAATAASLSVTRSDVLTQPIPEDVPWS
jgi:hypothetical protein